MGGEILINAVETSQNERNYEFAGFHEDGKFSPPEALVCLTGGVYEPIKDAEGKPTIFRAKKDAEPELIKMGPSSFMKGVNPYDPNEMGYGGKYRAAAVARLAKEFPQALVFTGATYGNLEEKKAGMPTHAKLYKGYLSSLGVKPERIVAPEDEFAVNTFAEMISEILVIAASDARLITFCTNAYHVPRVEQMLKIILDETTPNGDKIFENYKKAGWDLLTPELQTARKILRERKARVSVIAAEPVLRNIDQERGSHLFTNIVESVYQSELPPDVVESMGEAERGDYEERLALIRLRTSRESQGLSQLLDGTYTPNNRFKPE